MPTDLDPRECHPGCEVARIRHLDLEEHAVVLVCQVVVEHHLEHLLVVLLMIARVELVGDEADRARVGHCCVQHLPGTRIHDDTLDAQLSTASDAGVDAHHRDHHDEDARNDQAFRAFDDGHDERVGEHGGDDGEERGGPPVSASELGEEYRHGRRRHQG
ncbi:hypothetical protein [Nocardioides sp. B-3]|uniref:hypothetical protein n=1 Tax=Nocardioides sp. B-3 TaxID=2895565 RepID=UPI0021531B2B|nr:hypothetical protein [Nocardioides sp. B-3]UUZ59120.1 hypothetical protein LP418_24790 [Nocardioides sp. B-3]